MLDQSSVVTKKCINLGNFTTNITAFNKNLTNWLIEYNFHRPHAALNYKTPIEFSNSQKVLPMYPSGTLFLDVKKLCYTNNIV